MYLLVVFERAGPAAFISGRCPVIQHDADARKGLSDEF